MGYAIVLPITALGGGLVLPASDMHMVSRILLVTAFVVLARVVVLRVHSKKFFLQRVLILGCSPMAAALVSEMEASDDARYVVAGVVDDELRKSEAPDGTRWLGPPEHLAGIVERVRPTHIIVAVADRRKHLPLQPLLESRVRGIAVEDALPFYERLTGKIAIEALTPSTLFLSTGFRNHGIAQAMARTISVVAAAVGLIVFAPVLALIAVLIKLDSRGPVLFVQERAGRGGKPFPLLKLRTMHPSDEHPSEWVRDNEGRITRVGRWLRRFRLDELPQLLNVLRGDMDLIGPRPHPTANHRIFMERIAYYGLRSTVRPGVTGWAQVRYGYANNLAEETEKMRMDLYYIKNRSPWLDVRILFETVFIMLLGWGSSGVESRKAPAGPVYVPAMAQPNPVHQSTGRR